MYDSHLDSTIPGKGCWHVSFKPFLAARLLKSAVISYFYAAPWKSQCDTVIRQTAFLPLHRAGKTLFLKAQYLQVTEGHVDSRIKYTIVNVYASIPHCMITFLWFIFWYGLFLLPPPEQWDRPRGGISPSLYRREMPRGESCMISFGKHTAKLNGWSINFSGIDLHQFCLHEHTRSHFIVNQSFWKHLTEGPVLTNKPSIPAACVAPLSGYKSTATQTSAPFPSLSPSTSLCLYPPLCSCGLSCFDGVSGGDERRGCESSPHHLR